MLENNKENIFAGRIDYSMISLFSSKLRIGVVGAGRAGFIKAKHFYEEGCYIEVLTKEVSNLFGDFNKSNLKVINKEYTKEFIKDKHLIIIAVEDNNLISKITKDCDEEFKLYINSSSFLEGMGSIPVQRELDNAVIGINTRGGNPRGAVFLGNKIYESVKKYDEYIEFTTKIRNRTRNEIYKKEVLDFIFTEDFQFIFYKGYGDIILEMFYQRTER